MSEAALRALFGNKEEAAPFTPERAEGEASGLRERFAEYNKQHEFKVGDLVVWKDGMKNTRVPTNGQPAIVTDVLSDKKTMNEGAAYEHEIQDIVCGIIDEEGDFTRFGFNSSRFKPYEGN